jgi:hypothetical protein
MEDYYSTQSVEERMDHEIAQGGGQILEKGVLFVGLRKG